MTEIPAPIHRTALRLAHPIARLYWRMTRPHVSGAYAVIRRDAGTRDESWLFVTNTYKPGLTLPGGGIGRGEAPREAARRETLEEVGLDLEAHRFQAGGDFELEYMYRRDHVHFYAVDVDANEELTPMADGREIGWAGFRPLREIDSAQLALPVRLHLQKVWPASEQDLPGA